MPAPVLAHVPADARYASRKPCTSPASRARRRAVCIFPSHSAPSADLVAPVPVVKSPTLLPYYYSPPASNKSSPSIRSPPLSQPPVRGPGFGISSRPVDPLPLPPPFMYSHDNASSTGSTPQATFAETDSDASSFYGCPDLDLEFPQPPGLPYSNGSPGLRRMQSSPLFTPEETLAVREFLRRRWGAHVKARQIVNAPSQAQEPEPLSDFSWDAESPECGAAANDMEQLELAGEALLQAAPQTAPSSPVDCWTHNPSVAPLRPRRSAPPPHLLRRAASMAEPTTPPLHNAIAAPPVPSRSLRFQDAPPPSLASAGRQKPYHRPNLSMPLAGTPMGLGFPDAGASSGPSFTHRHYPTRSQPANLPPGAGAVPAGEHDPRSFIDLTPERTGSRHRESTTRVHRERVKRLLVRAKSGLIEWSKGLALASKNLKEVHHHL